MLYSKNGSIPMPETDGTEGWIEVPDAPVAPEGKEVVWWYPPGWIVRDPQPGPNWSWSQSDERWIEIVQVQTQTITTEQTTAITSSQIDMV
jgi:hypothetical protein